MQKYKGFAFGLAFTVALLPLVPLVASADTNSDLQVKIQALFTQIKALQEQLRSQNASSTEHMSSTTPHMNDDRDHKVGDDRKMMGDNDHGNQGRGDENRSRCAQVNRDLRFGSRGDDVKDVQKMLASDPSIFTGSTTGFFGKETAKAMARFQMKNGIAFSPTGIVGSSTRAFFGKNCASPRAEEVRGGQQGNMMSSTTRMMPPRQERQERPEGQSGPVGQNGRSASSTQR